MCIIKGCIQFTCFVCKAWYKQEKLTGPACSRLLLWQTFWLSTTCTAPPPEVVHVPETAWTCACESQTQIQKRCILTQFGAVRIVGAPGRGASGSAGNRVTQWSRYCHCTAQTQLIFSTDSLVHHYRAYISFILATTHHDTRRGDWRAYSSASVQSLHWQLPVLYRSTPAATHRPLGEWRGDSVAHCPTVRLASQAWAPGT
eukprot:347005-Rhodomonas_salina.2